MVSKRRLVLLLLAARLLLRCLAPDLSLLPPKKPRKFLGSEMVLGGPMGVLD